MTPHVSRQAANDSDDLRKLAIFSVLSLGTTIAFWRPLLSLMALARTDEEYTHILLVLPVSLALLVTSRSDVFRNPQWAIAPALGMGVLGAFLEILTRFAANYQLTTSIAALVLFWLTAFVLSFGGQAFRVARFPLLFLFLLVPLPLSVVNGIVSVLQKGSAEVAYRLLQMATIPVGRDGLILFLPGLNIEVAAECSSIRSSMLLFVTSVVMAHVFLRSTWKQIFVALLVLPIAIFKNGIRIFTLSVSAVYGDPDILSSWVHHRGGFLFFILGLAMVVFVVWLLRPPSKPDRRCPLLPDTVYR